MIVLRALASGLAAVLLAACAVMTISNIPFSDAPRPREGRALVYVYRGEDIAPFVAHDVKIDGKPLIALQMAEYSYAYLDPGKHTISVDRGGMASKPAAADAVFEIGPNEVAALALEYFGPRQDRPALVAGPILIPGTTTPRTGEYDWKWEYIQNFETKSYMYLLKRRWFRRAASDDLSRP